MEDNSELVCSHDNSKSFFYHRCDSMVEAVDWRHMSCMRRLVEQNRVNHVYEYNNMMLLQAATAMYSDGVDYLIKAGADVDTVGGCNGPAAAMLCVIRSMNTDYMCHYGVETLDEATRIVELLITAGADLEILGDTLAPVLTMLSFSYVKGMDDGIVKIMGMLLNAGLMWTVKHTTN